jgi:hypothetical protein
LWAYPSASRDGRAGTRLGSGPRNDDLDVVSHAPEDRGGVEKHMAALSLLVDPDKAQPKRRQLAVSLLRGLE